ncbi:hypothetical protein AB0E88_12460 [Streptomyces sp. NPDC028635]|uniref:hypothetical protein n=1 Tax=Streptomyces sp. NPDC028635 TaxID=3154800 RepID=UPI0033EAC252
MSLSLPHAPSSSSSCPRPPGADVPPTREVPHFAPVRVGGVRHLAHRLARHRRRAVAVGLAVTAAALVAAGPRGTTGPDRVRGHPPGRPAGGTVAAPVRIADAGTVRLLRPGDRVDVIAAEDGTGGGDARVVARGARVARLPEVTDDVTGGGTLVVLSVPRATAARLVGASATARLAVTVG